MVTLVLLGASAFSQILKVIDKFLFFFLFAPTRRITATMRECYLMREGGRNASVAFFWSLSALSRMWRSMAFRTFRSSNLSLAWQPNESVPSIHLAKLFWTEIACPSRKWCSTQTQVYSRADKLITQVYRTGEKASELKLTLIKHPLRQRHAWNTAF